MKVLAKGSVVLLTGLMLVMVLSSSGTISDNAHLIYWKENYRLKWSDFKGKPDNSTSMQALTFSSVKVHSHSEGNNLIVEVSCFFDPHQSWTKDTTHALLLNHEQLHFDITELYARMMRQKISQITEKDPKKKMDEVSKVVHRLMNECMAEQNKYDEQTRHGVEEVKQNEWVASVRKRLVQYAQYMSK